MGSSKIGTEPGQQEKVRINYYTKNFLIYSHFPEKINEAQQKVLNGFEEQFEDFTGQLTLLPEDLEKLLCRLVSRVARYHCECCPINESPMME